MLDLRDVSDKLPCGNTACVCRITSEEGIFKWGRRFCSEYCVSASNVASEVCFCGDDACKPATGTAVSQG